MPRKKTPKHIRDFEVLNISDTLKQVLLDMQEAVTNQTTAQTKFAEYYKQYRGWNETSAVEAGRSNLFIPYTATNVETVKAKLMNALFNERPFVTTRALNESDEEAKELSKSMNNFLQYQLEQKIKMIPKGAIIMLEMLMYGDAITEQKWEYKEKNVKKRRPAESQGVVSKKVLVEKTEKVITKDHPNIELVSVYDFFYDPTATDIESALFVIRRKHEDYSTLIADPRYKNVTKLKDSQTENFRADDNTDLSGERGDTHRKRTIEVLHYWTDDWHIVVGNRSVLLLKEENPYFHMEKPFSKWSFIPMQGEWSSVGLVELSSHLQSELNTTRNQRIDNVSMIINSATKVRRGANIDEDDLVSRPNGIIYVDEMDDIETMAMPDVTSSAYLEEDVIKADFDRVTGVHDMARGDSSGGATKETATMASLIDQHGNERFVLNLRLLEFGGFKDTMAQIIQLNQQFITSDQTYFIPETSGKEEKNEIAVEDIIREYDIIAVGNTSGEMANKEIKQNQLTNLLAQIAPYVEHVNVDQLLSRIFEVYNIKNYSELIKPEAQMQQEQQALMQQQAQEQQQAQTQQEQAMMQQQAQEQQAVMPTEPMPAEPAPERQGLGQGMQGQGLGQGMQGQGVQGQGAGQDIIQQVVAILSQQFPDIDPNVLAQIIVAVVQGKELPAELEPLREIVGQIIEQVQQGGPR
jgi:ribosomal protein L12E/L44/L45/RPP1/RPP2